LQIELQRKTLVENGHNGNVFFINGNGVWYTYVQCGAVIIIDVT